MGASERLLSGRIGEDGEGIDGGRYGEGGEENGEREA